MIIYLISICAFTATMLYFELVSSFQYIVHHQYYFRISFIQLVMKKVLPAHVPLLCYASFLSDTISHSSLRRLMQRFCCFTLIGRLIYRHYSNPATLDFMRYFTVITFCYNQTDCFFNAARMPSSWMYVYSCI